MCLGSHPSTPPQNWIKFFILTFICQPFGWVHVSFISGGPYEPSGSFVRFWGSGGSQQCWEGLDYWLVIDYWLFSRLYYMMMVLTTITNIVMIFIIWEIIPFKADYDDDSCNYNSNDLRNTFTLEGFLLLSIYHWRIFQCWIIWPAHRWNLQQQASSVWKKTYNWKTCGYFHLLALARGEGSAAVGISRCGQVGKGTQVFALRIVPRTERGWW